MDEANALELGDAPHYAMIGDPKLEVAKLYGMLPESAGESSKGRAAADNHTVRTALIIGLDKLMRCLSTR